MTVGLCMIVKDEAHVVERCLRSVAPSIDCWTIVDTGSTDGTQQTIERVMAEWGLPGKLHEREWVNFGYNRTQALELARGQAHWSLMIDADEVLDGVLAPPDEDVDVLVVRQRAGSTTYRLEKVFNNRHRWWYEGVLHEYPATDATDPVRLDVEVEVVGLFDSQRNRQTQVQKYARDAEMLHRALRAAPPHLVNRYTYYLARSYRDAGMMSHALGAFQRRVALGGWLEEVQDSLHQIALLTEALGADPETAYRLAVLAAPDRAEPMVEYARWLRENGRYTEAMDTADRARSLVKPDVRLFLDDNAYDWRGDDEYGLALHALGHRDAALATWRAMLPDVPAEHLERVERNIMLVEQEQVVAGVV
jgi:tetratricopeptide (TPR) repeat protein